MFTIILISIAFLMVFYCLRTEEYAKGLLIFFIYTSCIEGPLKIMTWGQPIKIVVYIIRDLMLFSLFARAIKANFFKNERKSENISGPSFVPLIIVYVIWCSLMVFHPNGLNLINSISGLRLHIEMIPLVFFGYYLMKTKKDFQILFAVILICALINALVSFIQSVRGIEWLLSIHPGYRSWATSLGRDYLLMSGETAIRPPALGPDMGFAGMYAILVIPAVVILFNLSRISKHKFLLCVCLIILLIGVVSSSARYAYVFAFISLFISLYMMNFSKAVKNKIHLIALIVLIIYSGFLTINKYFPQMAERLSSVKNVSKTFETFTSEDGRLYQATVLPCDMAQQYFLGNGLGKVGPGAGLFAKDQSFEQLNAENQLTLGIAETGVPGILLLLMFHILVYRYGIKWHWRIKDKELNLYSLMPLILLTLFLFYWPFMHLVTFPNNSIFWFSAGVVLRFKVYAMADNGVLTRTVS